MSRSRRLLPAAAAAVAFTAALAGCTPTVAMTAAKDANNPKCANVIVRLPDTVDGKKRDWTNAQSTGAWGDPVVVQLRCGVTPLGPTTKQCVTVNDIDWVLLNDPDDKVLSYVTYGRTPAVEVDIQHGSGGASDAAVLPDLADAVAEIPQSAQHSCVDSSGQTG
ncbi:DUF3515 family protein [Gryllotalpicola ginsengisoli]|uniref:DUF3515 family protein n=1 Tax=Gryllotalpicola ginsengisoli TaxID=444608 RepID=UPI0003B45057|nr:DUF3515 family protein [Gryllotalpicola ginsengisoli]